MKVVYILVFVYLLALLFPGLDYVALIDWDENIYAEASRQMLLRDNYLNIVINGQPFAEKPPFFFWLQVLSYSVFGINEFAARFPSTIAALLSALILFRFGRYLIDTKLGVIFALVYSSAFLPLLLSRASMIDHTFNMFIMLAVFSLFRYHRLEEQESERRPQMVALTIAALAMGLGVMTKGLLAGAIPVLSLAGYRLLVGPFRVNPWHLIYCGTISLILASSWYLANWVMYGNAFILDFFEFQYKLLSQSLDSHTGSWYYHLLSSVYGFLPWTGLLLFYAYKAIRVRLLPDVDLIYISLVWMVLVHLIFAVVQTKLPHYSASIYIPMTLLVGLVLHTALGKNPSFRWLPHCINTLILFVVTVAFFIVIPRIANGQLEKYFVDPVINNIELAYTFAAGCILLALVNLVAVYYRNIVLSVVTLLLVMLVMIQGVTRYHLPILIEVGQAPLVDMVRQANAAGMHPVFYRIVSFAALFYGDGKIEMLHTYKFSGDPSVLIRDPERDIAVMTSRNHESSLLVINPALELISRRGNFVLYRLPAQ